MDDIGLYQEPSQADVRLAEAAFQRYPSRRPRPWRPD